LFTWEKIEKSCFPTTTTGKPIKTASGVLKRWGELIKLLQETQKMQREEEEKDLSVEEVEEEVEEDDDQEEEEEEEENQIDSSLVSQSK